MTNIELLEKFKALSIEHFRASEQGDSESVNRGVLETGTVVRQLWQNNGQAKEALRELSELAKNEDPRIALRAIVYTVELFPEVAKHLDKLTKDKSLVGLGAKYTLRNLKEGKVTVLKETLGI